jgi:hypothetical protein
MGIAELLSEILATEGACVVRFCPDSGGIRVTLMSETMRVDRIVAREIVNDITIVNALSEAWSDFQARRRFADEDAERAWEGYENSPARVYIDNMIGRLRARTESA